jgi:hypothetical protein
MHDEEREHVTIAMHQSPFTLENVPEHIRVVNVPGRRPPFRGTAEQAAQLRQVKSHTSPFLKNQPTNYVIT